MKKRRLILLTTFSFLAACGEDIDSGSNEGANNIEEIDDIEQVVNEEDTDTSNEAICEITDLKVFVTSLKYSGNLSDVGGASSGYPSAQAICQSHAEAAGLLAPDYHRQIWRPWISDQASALERVNESRDTFEAFAFIEDSRERYLVGSCEDTVFGGRGAMSTTGPRFVINRNEFGEEIADDDLEIWTGTADGGGATVFHCNHWKNQTAPEYENDSGNQGTYGDLSRLDERGAWTEAGQAPCNEMKRILCIEDDLDGTI